MSTLALLLADARFPAGGHAHSGGVEPAYTSGVVTDVPSLELFLRGRLRTSGVTAAGLAAAACTPTADWTLLDAEADARTPSPAQRDASRRQGRALLRTARTAWPAAAWPPQSAPHHPIVLGAATAAAGCGPADAARVAAYQSVAGPASAAVRLLGLDPIAVSAVVARIVAMIDDLDWRDLPFPSAPNLDLLAECHATAEVRLFDS
ncbi:MAG: urease accessory UreF family protein [Streptosporangiaceae bacterium]|jgi:urease accessory protein